jgi:prevent-host-death family protein
MAWTLATAKEQLSEVVRRAKSEGPQTITVRGREEVVVLSKNAYEALTPAEGGSKDFKEHLMSFPKIDIPEFYEALEGLRRPLPPRDTGL